VGFDEGDFFLVQTILAVKLLVNLVNRFRPINVALGGGYGNSEAERNATFLVDYVA